MSSDPDLPDTEFYSLPDLDDLVYWDRLQAAGLHQPVITTPNGQPTGWHWLNLSDPEHAIPASPPVVHGLLYHGKRHVISGPPESAKTLVAYILLIQALRQDEKVAIIDFEMGPTAARALLDDLGATHDELAQIRYTEPDRPPTGQDLNTLVDAGVSFALIDAAAGAYDTSGLDDNARKDAEQFARTWTRPLWQNGVATITIDHVTKDAASRGKFAIGSERKVGQADIHLALEALKPLSRGHHGIVRVTVHKDRPGFLERPTAAVFELASDPEDHQITYKIRDPEPTDDAHWKPTILMERVSRYLEEHLEPVSRNQIEENVKGKSRKHIRQAIDTLVDDEYATETPGARGARIVTFVLPYRQPKTTPETTSPDLAPTSPGEVTPTSPDFAPPLQGGAGEVGGEKTNDLAPINIYDPELQKLLDDQPDY